MKIDLTEIARTPGAHAAHDFEEPLKGDSDVALTEPAKGRFTVTSTGSLLVLRGSMTAEVDLACGRCLEPIVYHLEAPISEEFSTQPAALAAENETIDVEEPDRAAFKENILDLTELVRQNIIINLPLKPLCREDCPGICARCGANLAAGACECPPEEPEGPLAELKRLIEPDQKGG